MDEGAVAQAAQEREGSPVTGRDPGRSLALHAGNRHIEGVLLRDLLGLVVVLAFQRDPGGAVGIAPHLDADRVGIALLPLFGSEGTLFHLYDANPFDLLRVAAG